jgi:uncharacterized protein (TIGR02687 family)
MSRITDSLSRMFERHRLVIWYDDEGLAGDLSEMQLPGIETLVIDNNEFGLKHRVLREEPKAKFLIYSDGERPDDLSNWLLDIELAHGLFQADQVALWLAEIGLGSEFADVVRPHEAFFKSSKRVEALARLISVEDTPRAIHLKMLGICADSESRLGNILEKLLSDERHERATRLTLIQKSGLEEFLWDQVERLGYRSDKPGLKDFSIALFKSCYANELEGTGDLTSDAILFMRRWKDSARYGEDYEWFADEFQTVLKIENDLIHRSLNEILDADTFELIDKQVLSHLAREVAEHTMSVGDVTHSVRARSQTHWYGRYKYAYDALQAAAEFFDAVKRISLSMTSASHGMDQYTKTWFRVDQLYRQFIHSINQAGMPSLFAKLRKEVDNRYSNQYLLPMGESWQAHVDESESWLGTSELGLASALKAKTSAFLDKGNKIVVVISDALRFEVGEELARRIYSEDRFDTDLDVALAPLPSFTQLGMASLLPHKTLTLTVDGKVLIDGASSQGLAPRQKVLDKANIGTAKALLVKDFLGMNGSSSKELTKSNDVLYLYHNRIDATGDKKDSEELVFEAAETAIGELMRVVKKLFSANASNVLITADHGFIYQDQELDDADFMVDRPKGEIGTINRRFVIGKNLKGSEGFKKFTSSHLGVEGDVDVLIPRSIYRLRVKGSGSRFVHGGASLQEVLVPILHVTKKRSSDVSKVEVDIIAGSTSIITTGQVAVSLYQTERATEKRKARTLRVGVYAKDGTELSDIKEITFDHSSEFERDRESKLSFILTSAANALNGQEVELRLEERFEETTHWSTYKSRFYTLRRSFTSDFDF